MLFSDFSFSPEVLMGHFDIQVDDPSIFLSMGKNEALTIDGDRICRCQDEGDETYVVLALSSGASVCFLKNAEVIFRKNDKQGSSVEIVCLRVSAPIAVIGCGSCGKKWYYIVSHDGIELE